ncbi:MAG: hypothetical protein H0W78_00830 [Planctomycetes bacterium]|jgi:hypothetical protein|nr:hypothetical protein [Planctomycetota bacterium]
MEWDLLQWPAMAVTVIGAWLLTSTARHRRFIGFGVFLLSNVLWVLWGLHTQAFAVILLQVCLALLNVRGLKENQ